MLVIPGPRCVLAGVAVQVERLSEEARREAHAPEEVEVAPSSEKVRPTPIEWPIPDHSVLSRRAATKGQDQKKHATPNYGVNALTHLFHGSLPYAHPGR
jgi:hypothetical protein